MCTPAWSALFINALEPHVHHLPALPPLCCRLRRRVQLQARITPHRVRHILVSFVQQNKQAFAGVEDQMATLMGHALRMWQVRWG